MLAYFITIFVAAPLALITGLGMSPALSTRFKRISRALSIQTARSLHFFVLVWFLLFIVSHVALVFTTGLLNNLNHIYAVRNDDSWIGFAVFAVSMVVVIIGWVAATPFTLRHPRVVQRVGFALIGPAQRLFEHVDSTPGKYTEKDISPYFWHNGQYPDSDEYKALFDGGFTDYRLCINGLVDPSQPLSRQVTPRSRTTNRSPNTSASRAGRESPNGAASRCRPSWRWSSRSPRPTGSSSTHSVTAPTKASTTTHTPIEQMKYHLTMLAYDMNGEPLSFGHGAPLRLRNETQLGFKQVKSIKGVEFVADFSDIGGGYGGYNQDHEFFGYRQSI